MDSVWLECELLSATDTHYTITLKDAPQQTGVLWKEWGAGKSSIGWQKRRTHQCRPDQNRGTGALCMAH